MIAKKCFLDFDYIFKKLYQKPISRSPMFGESLISALVQLGAEVPLMPHRIIQMYNFQIYIFTKTLFSHPLVLGAGRHMHYVKRVSVLSPASSPFEQPCHLTYMTVEQLKHLLSLGLSINIPFLSYWNVYENLCNVICY